MPISVSNQYISSPAEHFININMQYSGGKNWFQVITIVLNVRKGQILPCYLLFHFIFMKHLEKIFFWSLTKTVTSHKFVVQHLYENVHKRFVQILPIVSLIAAATESKYASKQNCLSAARGSFTATNWCCCYSILSRNTFQNFHYVHRDVVIHILGTSGLLELAEK